MANAVLDGVDGILLGAETLRGLHPRATVETILHICKQAEKVFGHREHFERMTLVRCHRLAPVHRPLWRGAGTSACRGTARGQLHSCSAHPVLAWPGQGLVTAGRGLWQGCVEALTLHSCRP